MVTQIEDNNNEVVTMKPLNTNRKRWWWTALSLIIIPSSLFIHNQISHHKPTLQTEQVCQSWFSKHGGRQDRPMTTEIELLCCSEYDDDDAPVGEQGFCHLAPNVHVTWEYRPSTFELEASFPRKVVEEFTSFAKDLLSDILQKYPTFPKRCRVCCSADLIADTLTLSFEKKVWTPETQNFCPLFEIRYILKLVEEPKRTGHDNQHRVEYSEKICGYFTDGKIEYMNIDKLKNIYNNMSLLVPDFASDEYLSSNNLLKFQ